MSCIQSYLNQPVTLYKFNLNHTNDGSPKYDKTNPIELLVSFRKIERETRNNTQVAVIQIAEMVVDLDVDIGKEDLIVSGLIKYKVIEIEDISDPLIGIIEFRKIKLGEF